MYLKFSNEWDFRQPLNSTYLKFYKGWEVRKLLYSMYWYLKFSKGSGVKRPLYSMYIKFYEGLANTLYHVSKVFKGVGDEAINVFLVSKNLIL